MARKCEVGMAAMKGYFKPLQGIRHDAEIFAVTGAEMEAIRIKAVCHIFEQSR